LPPQGIGKNYSLKSGKKQQKTRGSKNTIIREIRVIRGFKTGPKAKKNSAKPFHKLATNN
jgi:hypothetical protein